MRIAICGTHSVGKTTLLNKLAEDPDYSNCIFIQEIMKDLKDNGMKINEDGDDETQKHIMNFHKDNILMDGNVFMDRCSLDGLCYTEYLFKHNKVTFETYKYALKIFMETIQKYDVIFYIEPEFELVENGVRSVNKDFQTEVRDIFRENIEIFKIKTYNIKGSLEHRYKKVKDVLKDYKKLN